MTALGRFFTARTPRRALVVVAYAIPLFVFGTGRYEQGQFDSWTLLLGLSLLLLMWFNSFSGRVLKKAHGAHDERQRKLMWLSHSMTYRIVTATMLVSALIYMFLESTGPVFTFFFFASFYLLCFLPSSAIAWLEPDPVAEDTPASLSAEETTRPHDRFS